MTTRCVTRHLDETEHRLNAFQKALLRGWSVNMTFASAAQARRLGFDYSTAELDRFSRIAEDVSSAARAFWLIMFVIAYFAMSLPVIAGCVVYLAAPLLSLAAMIVTLFLSYTASAAISSFATDMVFQIAPLQQQSGDQELCQKVEWQLICIGLLAVIAAAVITVLAL